MDGDYGEGMEMLGGEDPDEPPEPVIDDRDSDDDVVPDDEPDVEVPRTSGYFLDKGITVMFRETDQLGQLVADPREMRSSLTKYERARALGLRAKQLSEGAKPLVDYAGLTDALDIAKKELAERKMPFLIRRKHNEVLHEQWDINELVQNERDIINDRALEIDAGADSAPKGPKATKKIEATED